MKKNRKGYVWSVIALSTIFALGTLLSCGGGGDGGATGPPLTAIETHEEGALAATISTIVADTVIGGGGAIVGLGEPTTPTTPASKLTLPADSKSRMASALRKFTAKMQPRVQQARTLNAINVTPNFCYDGGEAWMNDAQTAITFTGCRDMGEELNGVISITGTSGSGVLRFGSGGTPFVITAYEQDLIAPGYEYGTEESTTSVLATMSGSVSTDANGNEVSVVTANGYIENEDLLSIPKMKERGDMVNFQVRAVFSIDPITFLISEDITANGRLTYAYYEDLGSGYGTSPDYAESMTFYGLRVLSTLDTTANEWTYSINGTFAYDRTPDACFEGTFNFRTVTPVKFDLITQRFIEGEIVINGTTTVTYTASAVTVTFEGSSIPYTPAAYEGLCPNL